MSFKMLTMKPLLIALMGMACLHSAAATFPLDLLVAYPGVNMSNTVRVGEPRAIYDSSSSTYICLFQQGDGNFRVLRSATTNSCENNQGELIYHSQFSLVLGKNEMYFTSMQVDGNLLTRKASSLDYVWKTRSSQGDIVESFRLVLNKDDTLSILDGNDTTIWNSATDETRYFNRPLSLMTTLPGYPSRAWFVRPIKIRDRLADTFVCIIQQGDGNFRVIRGDDCDQNVGDLIFHSGLSVTLPNNEKYWTFLQRDGNLVTYREVSKKWAWATCSHEPGAGVVDDFELVLTAGDTLAIVDANGTQIWESSQDVTCFAP